MTKNRITRAATSMILAVVAVIGITAAGTVSASAATADLQNDRVDQIYVQGGGPDGALDECNQNAQYKNEWVYGNPYGNGDEYFYCSWVAYDPASDGSVANEWWRHY